MTSTSIPPTILCDTRVAIEKARRRAVAREVFQVALLVAVDLLFIRWADAHVPGIGREGSRSLLRALNAVVVAHLWLCRAYPRWTARRIAATWCRAEKQRFFDREY